jgi:hypothetical protein
MRVLADHALSGQVFSVGTPSIRKVWAHEPEGNVKEGRYLGSVARLILKGKCPPPAMDGAPVSPYGSIA